jgi:hypothetical protein
MPAQPFRSEFFVNTSFPDNQESPAPADGRFVVVWANKSGALRDPDYSKGWSGKDDQL